MSGSSPLTRLQSLDAQYGKLVVEELRRHIAGERSAYLAEKLTPMRGRPRANDRCSALIALEQRVLALAGEIPGKRPDLCVEIVADAVIKARAAGELAPNLARLLALALSRRAGIPATDGATAPKPPPPRKPAPSKPGTRSSRPPPASARSPSSHPPRTSRRPPPPPSARAPSPPPRSSRSAPPPSQAAFPRDEAVTRNIRPMTVRPPAPSRPQPHPTSGRYVLIPDDDDET